jgi:predicted nucleotidyltransferase
MAAEADARVLNDGQTLDAKVERLRLAGGDTQRRSIDAQTAGAARAFMLQIADRYAVVESILYGSRARGDYRPDSDADLAVVLRGERGDRAAVALDMARTAFHVMMETGVMVEALPVWEDEYEHPELFRNPLLIETIRREGVRL